MSPQGDSSFGASAVSSDSMNVVEPVRPLAPRTFPDKLFQAWFTSRETLWLGAFATLALQLVLSVFSPANSAFAAWWVWAAVTGLQFLFMLLRRCSALMAFAGQSAVVMTVELLYDAGAYSWTPFLYCLGTLILRCTKIHIALGIGFATATAVVFINSFTGVGNISIPVFSFLSVVTMFAAFLRARWNLLISKDERIQAERNEFIAAQKRLEAEEISRVASNLHDSVGHNLTGIITLTEGIMGNSNAEDIRQVVGFVNQLARDALAETRYAVRAIRPLSTEPAPMAPPDAMHTWHDIGVLVNNVRSTGLQVVVTKTGNHTEDPRAQELTFLIVRESLTNVLRHAPDATIAEISFTFMNNMLRLRVKDNGQGVGGTDAEGTGLKGLKIQLEHTGGTLEAGRVPTGWQVDAGIPLDIRTSIGRTNSCGARQETQWRGTHGPAN